MLLSIIFGKSASRLAAVIFAKNLLHSPIRILNFKLL